MMMHPGAASIDCRDCAEWLYDLETGQRETATVGPQRDKRFIPRPKGTPTPCGYCPKKSPQHAKEIELSPKNLATFKLWKRARATGGEAIPQHLRGDFRLSQNFAELDGLKEMIEQGRQNKMIAALLTVATKEGNV